MDVDWKQLWSQPPVDAGGTACGLSLALLRVSGLCTFLNPRGSCYKSSTPDSRLILSDVFSEWFSFLLHLDSPDFGGRCQRLHSSCSS